MDKRHRNKIGRMRRAQGLIDLPSLSPARLRPELQAMAKSAKVIREAPAELPCGWRPKAEPRGWLSRLWRAMRGRR